MKQESETKRRSAAGSAGPAGGPVKKSRNNICHAPESPNYQSVKNFTAYPNVDECLKSGGRLPKKPGG